MLYVQNIACAFVSVIGEVKVIQRFQESDLEESKYLLKTMEEADSSVLNEKDGGDQCCANPDFGSEDTNSRCDNYYFYFIGFFNNASSFWWTFY